MTARSLELASYQFFPQGNREKILLEENAEGVWFDFQQADPTDKLYIQLFDQGFQYPPSKLYRADAAFEQADVITITCELEANQSCDIQIFKMQYGQKKRMHSETEWLTLDGPTTCSLQLKRIKGADYFKIAFKFLLEGDMRVRLTALHVNRLVPIKQEESYHVI
ncbi:MULTISPECIES: hypothetical protein [Exiguobacterium]|uniref:Uncharacterized protein n=1 Tax=Exiguobacterium antarcticum TaxID=132920 RepID=A0ABT6QZS0_9BACL|nr:MULTISPECIES: hypothetical protein [Exiguobacterium]AFS69926.1 Hypothetical protein Eab7_0781 [Exiguobacterium antarcticum B7]MCT4780997.1 hypothetical protein [Exiguobacterium soli]MDI3234048.1 hypothetical protein [Exiguobacterium antarcticum]